MNNEHTCDDGRAGGSSRAQRCGVSAAQPTTYAPQDICMSHSANFEQTIILLYSNCMVFRRIMRFDALLAPRAQAPDWLAVVPPEVPAGE